MKTILVAIDGSRPAGKALEVALDLATQHAAQIKLLHVLLRDKEPEELLRLFERADVEKDLVAELKRLAQRPGKQRSPAEIMANPNIPSKPVPVGLLRRVGTHFLRGGSTRAEGRRVPVEALKIADGEVAPTIMATARAVAADAIVMGSRGLRLIDALGFGSASQEVCREAHCTCIVVH
jgi:nucleotide-binding universal stress UspA family protein